MSRHRDPLISVYISLLHGSTSPHTRFSRAASRPRAVRRRETADGHGGRIASARLVVSDPGESG